jgi:photosystem II stability/assembly factor-like uncharacterized protein
LYHEIHSFIFSTNHVMKTTTSLFFAVFTIVFFLTGSASAQWLQTGPNGIYITFTCLAASGANLFAGTSVSDGIYRSTDGGNGWMAVDSGFPIGEGAGALAVSGTNIFAGTSSSGVFLSTNNGTSWEPVNRGFTDTFNGVYGPEYDNPAVQAFAVIGADLFAGTYNGIYLSTNDGASWAADSSMEANVRALAVRGSNLFAGSLYSEGVYRSTDSGGSWALVDSGLAGNGVISVFAFAELGTNLFAGTNDGVFLSTDRGTSWTAVNNGIELNADTYVEALAVSGTNLFAGISGGGVYLSTNNGTSWIAASTGLIGDALDVNALAVSGTNLFAGTGNGVEGGIWRRPLSEMISTNAVAPAAPAEQSISAYPNPLTQSTTIAFASEGGYAKVSVVNLLGEEVARLFEGELAAGNHSFAWDASTLPPGMYECVVQSGAKIQPISMIVAR